LRIDLQQAKEELASGDSDVNRERKAGVRMGRCLLYTSRCV